MKKGNYNFPWIPPIARIPWNRPGLKNAYMQLSFC